jgi:SAM-dependent methyltransferase
MLLGDRTGIVGFDASLIELLQARPLPVYAAVAQGDATRLPFRSGAFGSVLCNCVLEHIPDDEAALGETARILRPGGRLVLTVPGPRFHEGLYTYKALKARGERHLAQVYLREVDQRLAHYHYRDAAEWRGLLANAGFDLERLEPYMVEPALSLWDRMQNYLTQPVYSVLSHKKLAPIILLPERLRSWLLHHWLRKYYLMEGAESDLHGCWLIVAQRS